MTKSRLTNIAIRTTALGALLAGFTTVAAAQKEKHQAGPPVTTMGTMKSNPKADKGQATAEAKRADARDDKIGRDADKADDRAHRSALEGARSDPKGLLKGIKLSSSEKKSVKATEKRYADQFKALKKQYDAAEKSGHPDLTIAGKIAALRVSERAELRAALSPAEQTQFDKNAATIGTKKP